MPLGRVQNITGLQISPLAGNRAHQVFDESLKRPHYCVLKIQVLYLAACNKKINLLLLLLFLCSH